MKIYPYLSLDGFSNCYIIGNDATKEAIIIDPGKMTKEILCHIEDNNYDLVAILITHNHTSHCRGLATLRKIYHAKIYAADYEVAGSQTIVLKGDGILHLAGMTIEYCSVPGHTPDSMTFKIGSVIFTGDALTAGLIGSTSNSYAERTLQSNITSKLLKLHDDMVIMPGHGPPSTIGAEIQYNISVGTPIISSGVDSLT